MGPLRSHGIDSSKEIREHPALNDAAVRSATVVAGIEGKSDLSDGLEERKAAYDAADGV